MANALIQSALSVLGSSVGAIGTAVPIQSADQELANIAERGLPAPPEMGKANLLMVPQGAEPSRGWFLCKRGDLDQCDLNGLFDLQLQDSDDNGITARDLVIVQAVNVSPGAPDDPAACYLVEVADRRWQLC